MVIESKEPFPDNSNETKKKENEEGWLDGVGKAAGTIMNPKSDWTDYVGAAAGLVSKLPLPTPIKWALGGVGPVLKGGKYLFGGNNTQTEAAPTVAPPAPAPVVVPLPAPDPQPINIYNTPNNSTSAEASNDRDWSYERTYAPRQVYRFRQTYAPRKRVYLRKRKVLIVESSKKKKQTKRRTTTRKNKR